MTTFRICNVFITTIEPFSHQGLGVLMSELHQVDNTRQWIAAWTEGDSVVLPNLASLPFLCSSYGFAERKTGHAERDT